MRKIRHAVITSILMLSSHYAFGDVENKVIPIRVLFDRGNIDTDTNNSIPLNLSINDHVIADKARLAIDSSFLFIFEDESTTLKDLAVILSSLSAAKMLKFSCSTDKNEQVCEKYDYFTVYFDFDRGELNVKYRRHKDSLSYADSSPLVVLSHNTNYSESRAGANIYKNGMWNGFLTTGLSQFNTLMSALRYDFNNSKISLSETRIEHEGALRTKIAAFFSDAPSNALALIGGKNVRGVSLSSIEQRFQGMDAGRSWEPIIIESGDDGIFNIYDGYDNIVLTLTANKGINVIQIPQSVNSERIKIDLIVDGKIKGTFDRINNKATGYDSEWDISMGLAEINTYKTVAISDPVKINDGDSHIIEKKTVHKKNDDSIFLRGKLNSGNKILEVGSVPSQKSYAFSASYNLMRYLSTSIDSSFHDNKGMHRTIVGHSNAFDNGISYFANLISNFSDFNTHSFNAGVSHTLKNQDRVNIYLHNSSGRYGTDKKLSASYAMSLRALAGDIDVNIFSSTNLARENALGLSMNFRLPAKHRWLEPSARLNWQNERLSTQFSNRMNLSDFATVVPELEFGKGMSSRYGALANISTPYQSFDGGIFSSGKNQDLNISTQGSILMSKHGVQSTSNNENISYYFVNNASKTDYVDHPVAMNINNTATAVTHGTLINQTSNRRNDIISIYSDNNKVQLDTKYTEFSVMPYRVYNIDYHHDTSLIVVSGRIINYNTPVNNVLVINHAGKTLTNDNGYFSLLVSKLHPNVSFKINDTECHKMIVDVEKSITDEIFLGRIPCKI